MKNTTPEHSGKKKKECSDTYLFHKGQQMVDTFQS